MEAIKIENVTKIYKNKKKALDNLDMVVNQGEIFSLLGNNGAGKSTLINILNTYEEVTSGNIKILGRDISNKNFVRSNIACVSQNISVYNHLSLYENMIFQSKLYSITSTVAKKRIEKLIDEFKLREYIDRSVSTYSGGVKRRLDIAMSMISHPKILFLDEPTVGMDIESRKSMWEVAKTIRDNYNTTIFLTTHYLEEADLLSDKICIIKDGHQIIQGSPEELRNYIKQKIVKIEFSNEKDTSIIKLKLDTLDFVKFSRIDNKSLYIEVTNSREDLLYINKLLIDNNIYYTSIELVNPSLGNIFLKIINSDK